MNSDTIRSALAMFVSRDRTRSGLRRPFFKDNIGYATDARCAIRILKAEAFDESKNDANFLIEKLEDIFFTTEDTAREVSVPVSDIYSAAFMAIANCHEYTPFDAGDELLSCDEFYVDAKALVKIDGYIFDAVFVKKAIDALRFCSNCFSSISVKMTWAKDKYSGTLLAISAGDVCIIIMGCRPSQYGGERFLFAHSMVDASGDWCQKITEDIR